MKIRSLRVRPARRGFTLVEILVVMTIIALLIAILVPALGFVREHARGTQCKSSLRNFYIGFAGLADKTRDGKYTTGAFDPWRDGCPDSFGWVADLVNAKVCKPQELLCPSNPAQGSEKYKDLVGTGTGSSSEGQPNEDLRTDIGACKLYGGVSGTYTASGTSPNWTGTQFADNMLAKGYGTNHMTTWFLSRSIPKTSATVSSSGAIITHNVSTNGKVKSLNGSKGPLKRRTVDNSPVSSNIIPFMGDSNVGDTKDRGIDEDITATDGTIYLSQGDPLVESFSDGPCVQTTLVSWQTTTGGPGAVTIVDGTTTSTATLSATVAYQEQPPVGVAPKWNNNASHLQDYRDFGPVHGGATNVLFADGSVKSFNDSNGDGFVNPGFAGGDAATKGYVDASVELPAAEIFSGILLDDFNITTKGTLDP